MFWAYKEEIPKEAVIGYGMPVVIVAWDFLIKYVFKFIYFATDIDAVPSAGIDALAPVPPDATIIADSDTE